MKKITRPYLLLNNSFKNYIMGLNYEQPVEPLMSNRWVVLMNETFQKIPPYIFTDFKLETEVINSNKKVKQSLKLTLHCYNTVHFLLTPDDVINTSKIKIEFLDPTGTKVNHYDMVVELDRMTLIGDYGSSDLLKNELVFWVKSLNPWTVNSDIEKETLENYKKN